VTRPFLHTLTAEHPANIYSSKETTYRDAMESVSLALQAKGMPIDDILDVLTTAIDAYENHI
jgi:hypothetical protein